ncbi:MAG: hypothetical protein BGP21_06665 [Thiobacillus sp. 65-29]|jgi:drug/metabolite transporter (DMT)-like permease|nr:MAG: hypothetical protein BGP21_06665 [Thiobacillus sp. 65-29]
MRKNHPPRPEASALSTHILPTAANLVGACVCAVPLVQLLPRHGWAQWLDETLVLAALVFIVSAGISYFSLRFSGDRARVERLAERIFLLGLLVVFLALVGLAVFFA